MTQLRIVKTPGGVFFLGELGCLSDAELERIMDTSSNIPTDENKPKVCSDHFNILIYD